jgi:hypothetical protein
MRAPFILEGPMDGEGFLVYVEQVLAPTLRPGDVVIIDNLPAHRVAGAKMAIEAKGATLIFLPPYSPDFNPIEKASQSSRRTCERLPPGPSMTSRPPSPTPSRHSQPPSAITTSPLADTTQNERKML